MAESLISTGIFKREGIVYDAGDSFKRVIVRNRDEVFFAQGSTIRYTRLSKDSSYSILNIPSVDFDIVELQSNKSGTLLAVYGKEKVVVVSTSFKRSSTRTQEQIDANSFVVGGSIYGVETKIIQVLWNSISRYDSSLVILSTDGVIRTFNIRFSSQEPDLIYDLSSSNTKKIGLTDNTIENPVSMCFGSYKTLSGALTLYILNQDGDIFTIYPFISKEIAVPRSFIENLFNETLLLSNSSDESNSKTDASALQQLRFVTYLWSQLPTSPKEVRGSDELCVLRSNTGNFYIQGPLGIQPYPNSLYDDYGMEITSLENEESYILLVSYQKNGFITISPDTNLFMKLTSNEEDGEFLLLDDSGAEFPTLSLIDHITFGASAPLKLGSRLSESSYSAKYGNDIIKVDFSDWIDSYIHSIRTGDSNEFFSKLNSGLKTKISSIFKLDGIETLEGLATFHDEQKNQTVILTSKRTHLISDKKKVESSISGRPESANNPLISKNDSLLSTPYSEITNLLKLVKNINVSAGNDNGSKIKGDDHYLREMDGASAQVLKYIVDFHKVGLALNSRLIKQKKELHNQIKKSHESSQKLKELRAKISKNRDSATEITERQNRIDSRIRELESKLRHSVDLPLSVKEKSWFKEIKNLTLFFNGGVKQSRELREQLSFIKNALQSNASSLKYTEAYTDDQDWKDLNRVIKEGELLLKQTTEQLRENSAQIGPE